MSGEGFAAVPTWMIRDESISIYAITTYAALATRSGLQRNVPGQETLAREARCSERKVRDAIKELEEIGVVERVSRRSKKGYRIPDGFRLLDRPLLEDELPARDAGRASLPAPEDTPTGTRQPTLPLIEVDSPEVEITPSFEDFWAVWPKKNSRRDAERAWARAVKTTSPQVIVEAAKSYASSPFRPEKQFVPYGATWLNGERWNDPMPEPAQVASRPMPMDRMRDALDAGQRVQAAIERGELVG